MTHATLFPKFSCMHPITVYGIETTLGNKDVYCIELHAPYYRLRY